MTKDVIKALWVKHGGSQHAPHVEHYVIEEQAFYRFATYLVMECSERGFRAGWAAREDSARGGYPGSPNTEQAWRLYKREKLS